MMWWIRWPNSWKNVVTSECCSSARLGQVAQQRALRDPARLRVAGLLADGHREARGMIELAIARMHVQEDAADLGAGVGPGHVVGLDVIVPHRHVRAGREPDTE